LVVRIQGSGNETSVDSGNNEVFQLTCSLQREGLQEISIAKILGVFGEGEEGKLAQLKRLGFVYGGEGGCAFVVGVGTIAEDSKESEVGDLIRRFGEGLDLWCLEEFSEEVSEGFGQRNDEIPQLFSFLCNKFEDDTDTDPAPSGAPVASASEQDQ